MLSDDTRPRQVQWRVIGIAAPPEQEGEREGGGGGGGQGASWRCATALGREGRREGGDACLGHRGSAPSTRQLQDAHEMWATSRVHTCMCNHVPEHVRMQDIGSAAPPFEHTHLSPPPQVLEHSDHSPMTKRKVHSKVLHTSERDGGMSRHSSSGTVMPAAPASSKDKANANKCSRRGGGGWGTRHPGESMSDSGVIGGGGGGTPCPTTNAPRRGSGSVLTLLPTSHRGGRGTYPAATRTPPTGSGCRRHMAPSTV